ncbi:hypothetical protein ACFOSS_11560 [Pseudaeromonas sharmana]|uniref:Uncharacterized protein n=1 Tax=Pseudaeromonas sharmana TaxID=328412 RepID=A0ABV8CQC5_9GAMM
MSVQELNKTGNLYTQLTGLPAQEVFDALFMRNTFDHQDSIDLDLLWSEYCFTERQVVDAFVDFQQRHPVLPEGYQEAILWHGEHDPVPSQIAADEFRMASQIFHEKAGLFNGTVRLIGGFLNQDVPNRRGLCRWIAPNTFVMLYVVRQSRGPFFGYFFPKDGGTTVSMVMW